MAAAARGGTGVVVGAGIAGLAVAGTLADRFERVVVLDRDHLPTTATPRPGAPQTFHPHVLLAAGQRALETLFPGLRDELIRAGATPFDAGEHLRFHRYDRLWSPAPLRLGLVSTSRPLLELALRRRVAARAGVTVRDGVAVSGLTGGGGRVTGVVLGDGEVLPADLVVDCSGRGSRSDRWLADWPGHRPPAAVEVTIGVGYATRLYRRRAGDLPGGVAVLVLPAPPHQKRAGVMLPVEGDRWLVALAGVHGDHVGADPDAFLRSAQALPYPAIGEIIARAQPLSDVVAHRFPASRRRRFERLRRPPAGYLTAGDAVCSFNPVYGQGMTCAALEAVALGRLLDRHHDVDTRTARAFYRVVARILAVPWRFAVGADFAYPQTTGPKPPATALVNAWSRRLQEVAAVDPRVRRTFFEVQHLVTPPAALFSPAVVVRVLRGARAP